MLGNVRTIFMVSAGTTALAWSAAGAAEVDNAKVEEAQAVAAATADDPRANTEIVVTAAKRVQTLAEVPISVSVVSSDLIEKSEAKDILDLQSSVPSLQVNQRNLSSQTNFVIRGFGNGANNVGIEPSVGFFIDGVYRSRSASSLTDFIDVERIEVLRGPQSTLFGKNASAGVVSVITKRPTDEFEGRVEASYGNYDAVKVAGTVSGPLTSGVSGRLSAVYNRRDGYIENINDGTLINNRDRFGVRGKLLFEPSPDLEILIAADYERSRELCCGIANLVNGPTAAVIGALGGTLVPEDPYSYRISLSTNPRNNNDFYGFSGHINYSGSWFDLTSITSFRNAHANTNADVDVTNVEVIQANINDVKIDTFTQEIRISSKDEAGPIDWFVGGFFFKERIRNNDILRWGAAGRSYVNALLSASGASVGLLETLTGRAPGSFFGSGQGIDVFGGQSNTSFSVFGVVDWEPLEGLKLTLGGNYTHDSKDVFQRATTNDVYSQTDLTPLTPLIGAPAVRTLQGLQIFPQFLAYPNAVESGISRDGKFTYSARLAYNVTPDINVFASIATGFKASSWNMSRDSRPFAADFPAITTAGLLSTNLTSGSRFARPEDARVIELGVKGFFDDFRFTATLFDQQIEDFQTFVFLGSSFSLANAEKRSAQGFEVDMSVDLTKRLNVWAAGTFLDPKYDSYTQSAFGDLSGTVPSQIPKTSLSVGGNYEIPIGSANLTLQTDYHYQSNSAFEDNPTLQAAVGDRYFNSQNIVNASATLDIEDTWTIRLWARNVFNDKYLINFAFPTPLQTGSFSGLPGQPRTYGVTVSAKF